MHVANIQVPLTMFSDTFWHVLLDAILELQNTRNSMALIAAFAHKEREISRRRRFVNTIFSD
jgi:hypothetical protein